MMMITLLLAAILLSHSANLGSITTMNNEDCVGAIGKIPASYSFASLDTLSGISGLFLNTKYVSTCNGTVIGWDFCYYILLNFQQNETRELMNIQAGVWRKEGGEYHVENRSLIELPISNPRNVFQFVCSRRILQDNETFEVQKGDIVGMFVNDFLSYHLLHSLGTSGLNEQHGGIKTINISDITTPVLESQLHNSSHSLYLMAIIGDFPEMSTDSPNISSTEMCTESVSYNYEVTERENQLMLAELTEREIFLIAVVALLLLIILLLITIIVAISCCQLKRTKSSGPVLITKQRYNHRPMINRMPPGTMHESSETEAEQNRNMECTDYGLPPLNPPPILVMETVHSVPDQGEVTSPSNSLPPVVCTVAFDDGQPPNYDQGIKAILKPKQQSSGIKIRKNVRFELRRSHSAAEAMNRPRTGTVDTESQCTSSVLTDYPYVFHSFEVVGKDRAHIGSLPNIHQFSQFYGNLDTDNLYSNSPYGVKPPAVERDNLNGYPYRTCDFNNFDDELSYTYQDKKRVVQAIPSSLQKTASGENTDYHYEDYPQSWTTRVAQLARTTATSMSSACEETNDVSPPIKSQTTPKHKTKPTVQPRKKLIGQVTQHPHAIAKHCDSDMTNDGGNPSTQKHHKYMNLLSSTMEDFHKYSYLQNRDTELSELTISDIDIEQTHPN